MIEQIVVMVFFWLFVVDQEKEQVFARSRNQQRLVGVKRWRMMGRLDLRWVLCILKEGSKGRCLRCRCVWNVCVAVRLGCMCGRDVLLEVGVCGLKKRVL
jgi:hypothetical protein